MLTIGWLTTSLSDESLFLHSHRHNLSHLPLLALKKIKMNVHHFLRSRTCLINAVEKAYRVGIIISHSFGFRNAYEWMFEHACCHVQMQRIQIICECAREKKNKNETKNSSSRSPWHIRRLLAPTHLLSRAFFSFISISISMGLAFLHRRND